jgi:ADP-ribose pyrophosphatase YjhB (NUDIX family)
MRAKQVFHAYEKGRAVADSSRFRYCSACAEPLPETSPEKPHPTCNECGWTLYRNPAPGVVILITEGESVLLGRRGGEGNYAPGKWCLPGGYIEFEEDFLTAAIREVQEETGLEVEIISLLSVMSNFLKPGLHTLVVVLKAQITGGTFQPGDDLTELGWYPLSGPFPEMAFEADRSIIEYFHATGFEGAPVDQEFAQ